MNFTDLPLGDPQVFIPAWQRPEGNPKFRMPYPEVESRYGAPMGREDWVGCKDRPVKFHLARVRGTTAGIMIKAAHIGGTCTAIRFTRPTDLS